MGFFFILTSGGPRRGGEGAEFRLIIGFSDRSEDGADGGVSPSAGGKDSANST